MGKETERNVNVTFPKVPFPMTAKKSKSVGRALEQEKGEIKNEKVPFPWNFY